KHRSIHYRLPPLDELLEHPRTGPKGGTSVGDGCDSEDLLADLFRGATFFGDHCLLGAFEPARRRRGARLWVGGGCLWRLDAVLPRPFHRRLHDGRGRRSPDGWWRFSAQGVRGVMSPPRRPGNPRLTPFFARECAAAGDRFLADLLANRHAAQQAASS